MAEFQPQAVDDTLRNLALDSENVGQLRVIPARPQGEIVTHTNQPRVDPQLLAGAKNRAFQNEFGTELLSRIAYVLLLAFEGKRRSFGTHREPFNDRQTTDELAREAVRKIVVIGIPIQINQRQHCDRNRLVSVQYPLPP